MSEKANWKSSVVLYGSFVLAVIALTLAPENWAFLAAAAIVLGGWFVSESVTAAAAKDESAKESDLASEALSIVSGSLFFGLLAALILPGLGVVFELSATPIYAAGIVLGLAFGFVVYRGHPRWSVLLACASFIAPVICFAFRWYNA